MKVVTVVGARPEFIKSLSLLRALADAGIENLAVHTGQHYDPVMSEIFFRELDLSEPWRQLECRGSTHATQTASMLVGVEAALEDAQPDWVVVYGDTNSTLAGALAAVKLNLPVAHVEAGLRSFNWLMPEEINRVLVDRVSTLLFAPGTTAVRNLEGEGFEPSKIHEVGDVNLDVLRSVLENPRTQTRTPPFPQENYALVTLHRAETTDDGDRLRRVLSGLNEVARHIRVVLPLHPRTRSAMEHFSIDPSNLAIKIIDPVGFVEMVELMRHASVIATDSGGIQKEALFLEVPCVTLRTETEWVETVDLGWNQLADLSSSESVARDILGAIGRNGLPGEPYGKGDAGERIAAILSEAKFT
jgi:UDP-GlcNAc3NAcA epimerase